MKQLGDKKIVATERFANGSWWYSETVRNIQLASSRLSTRLRKVLFIAWGYQIGIPLEHAHSI